MRSKLYVPKKGFSVDYGESRIYTVNDGVYKEFRDNISLSTRRKKKERLKYLQQFEDLKKYYPQIEYFVEYLFGLYIKGYVMEEVDTNFLDAYSISPSQKLSLLKEIRKVLNMFREAGLMYYDIHPGNIKYNSNGLPIFLDIDSILYCDEEIPDIKPHGLDYYQVYNGKLDENFQRVKFNVLAQQVLVSCQDLEYDEIGQEMIDNRLNVYTPKSIFAHEELIDHVSLKKVRNG